MLKRVIAILFLIIVILSAGAPVSRAGFEVEGVSAALLIDANTDTAIIEHNSQEELKVAGLVRLAPLLLICKAFDSGMLNDDTVVTVSSSAAQVPGPTAFVMPNEQIEAQKLLLAAIMINAGDAIYALAETSYGTESSFVSALNDMLTEMKLDLRYDNIDGNGTTMCARELAVIGKALCASESFLKLSTCYYEKITHSTGAKETELANPNKLIKQYSGCIGVATGSSQDSGYSGVFSVKRGTTSLICVVIGAADSSKRFMAAQSLLDYGFSSYRSIRVIARDEVLSSLEITGGMEKKIDVLAAEDVYALLPVSDAKFTHRLELPETIEAPITKNEIIGNIIIINNAGEEIAREKLVCDRDVEVAGVLDYARLIISYWLSKI